MGRHKWEKGDVCLKCKAQRREVKRPSRHADQPFGAPPILVTVVEYSVDDGRTWSEAFPRCAGDRR